MPSCIALVVAAGRGQRFGADGPKQYEPLQGHALIWHALSRLLACKEIDAVRVVIHPDDQDRYLAAIEDLDCLPPVFGGDSRQESVRLGLESLEELEAPVGTVLIHDAARPFVTADLISDLLEALADYPGALPALPVADTLKRGAEGKVTGTLDRQGLWRAQTPQAFHYRPILTAHRAARGQELTDDVAVAEAAHMDVALVTGQEDLFKVTHRADLRRAETHLASQLETRVGSGFDVHRFVPGDQVTLCGVTLPHSQRLSGHSDADVGLHALTDAILGGLADGDIGSHFPPSDPQWKGADSALFLRHARDLVRAKAGHIRHVDITLICEAPKVGPHRAAMVTRVAELLELPPQRVSIKATTTEKLGFTGRNEGIAAQATATLALPALPQWTGEQETTESPSSQDGASS
ncbi:bifunctional 2-C-methyl-D-erythritol 4-phosphate cytidylyltransferase/2-C-methyl-D-erythritol 2,4-cyclodiphosphate synthase [Rhodovibrionaceae bacterium A322]